MHTILDDIELDIKELKELIELAVAEPMLVGVVKRRIQRIQKRLSDLGESLSTDSGKITVLQEEVLKDGMELLQEESSINPIKDMPAIEEVVQVVKSEVKTISVQTDLVLGERLKPATDLSKSFSLNDSFRFSRELFDGDLELMNHVLGEISELDNMDSVMSHLSSRLSLDEENDALADFLELLKKYFD